MLDLSFRYVLTMQPLTLIIEIKYHNSRCERIQDQLTEIHHHTCETCLAEPRERKERPEKTIHTPENKSTIYYIE